MVSDAHLKYYGQCDHGFSIKNPWCDRLSLIPQEDIYTRKSGENHFKQDCYLFQD